MKDIQAEIFRRQLDMVVWRSERVSVWRCGFDSYHVVWDVGWVWRGRKCGKKRAKNQSSPNAVKWKFVIPVNCLSPRFRNRKLVLKHLVKKLKFSNTKKRPIPVGVLPWMYGHSTEIKRSPHYVLSSVHTLCQGCCRNNLNTEVPKLLSPWISTITKAKLLG